jgi:hypothetical protein
MSYYSGLSEMVVEGEVQVGDALRIQLDYGFFAVGLRQYEH